MTSVMTTEGPRETYRVKGTAFGLAIIVLSGMYFLSVLDGTVVFVALPKIQDALGLSDAARLWVFGAYAVAFGGLMLLGGRLGDAFGRKKMFVWGVGAFTVTSVLAALAGVQESVLGVNPEMWLLTARALQGASAAVACPTALALVATTFAPGKARNQAFAIFAAMAGIGSVAGLVAGGVLATWDWSLVFWINVPVGIACVVGGIVALEESASDRRHALDVKGAVLAVVGFTAGIYALTSGPEAHWRGTGLFLAAGLAVVCMVGFLLVERTAKNPILPFSLFRNRNRVAAMVAILVCGALIPTLGFYVALMLQVLLGYEPWQSGTALVPFAVGMGISAGVSSKLALKIESRWLVLIGGIIVLFPCLYVPTLVDDVLSGISYFPQIAIPVFFIGLGVGMALIPLTLSVVAGVRPSEIGPLTALAEVAQNLGGVGGLAVVQVLVASRIMSMNGPTGGDITYDAVRDDPGHMEALASGYSLAFLACAGILVLAGLVVVPFMRFTPDEVAEGQAAQESNKSGGAIPSTSFPAQAFEDDQDEDADWAPIEGDVTSGSFPAVRREDFDRVYNEQPGEPEPVFFTDRFRAIKRPKAPDPVPDESATTAMGALRRPESRRVDAPRAQVPAQPDLPPSTVPAAAPVAGAGQVPGVGPVGGEAPLGGVVPSSGVPQHPHPSAPLPRRGAPLEGVARSSDPIHRPSGAIQRESADLRRPPEQPGPHPAEPQAGPPQPVYRQAGPPQEGHRRPGSRAAGPRPSQPLPRPSGALPRPSGALPRPSGAIPRPSQPLPRPSGALPRPSQPINRPSGQVPRPGGAMPRPGQQAHGPGAPMPEGSGRHAAGGSDGMHHPEPSSQADRVSRARRHRRDDD